MADDQVTIDPEFRPPPPDRNQSTPLKTIGAVGVVVAAFAFGWLMRTPEQIEPEPDEAYAAAATTSTTGPGEIESATTTRPSTTTTSEAPETIELVVPLSEAVPGLTDIVTIQRGAETGVDIMRWRPWQPAPETVATFRDSATSWFAGLDASATWYALQSEDGVLNIHRVDGADAELPWSPNLQAVGVRVNSMAWHDTQPGQLAWLTCSRAPGGPGTLFSLDAADGLAEPTAVRSVDRVCTNSGGTWLHGWGDWGFAMGAAEGEQYESVILDVDGSKIDAVGDGSTDVWFVAGGPGGTILAEEGPDTRRPILFSPDGQTTGPVPGLAEGEWLEDARWSADGTLLALSVRNSDFGTASVRIVELPTGAVLAEFSEPGWEVGLGAWSSDSRFLLTNRWRCLDDCDWGEPQEWTLGFFDIATAINAVVPIPKTPDGDGWVAAWLTHPATPATLVAHYPLDNDATVVGEHIQGGTVIGATPASDRFGARDAAYAFDGEDDRIVIDMSSHLATDTVSIAAWVRMDGDAAPRPIGEWWDIVSYGDQGHVLGIQGEGAILGGLRTNAADCAFMGNETVFDGSWHHVAMTRDANWVIRLYLDGVVQATTPHVGPAEADTTADAVCSTPPTLAPTSVWIGGDWLNSESFHGSIDDVRIYSGVLTDEEITVLAAD